MINELGRNILYFIEIVLAKPFYAIVPGLVALLVGAYFIYAMPRSYYSDALLLMEFQQIPTTLVSPTVSNDRLLFIEQRVLSRNSLLALADKHDLFPNLRGALPKNNFSGVIRNHITLQISVTDGADRTASNASVRIGFKYDDPVVAANVVSDLVSQVIEENRRIRTARASEATKFLTQEANNVTQRLRERESAWTRYLEENKESHPTRIPTLLIELQTKELELATLDRAAIALNEEIGIYEAQLRIGPGQTTEITRFHGQLIELERDFAVKSVIYSDTHPQIRAMKQRLEEMRAQVAPAAPRGGSATMPTPEQIKTLPPELMLIAERIAMAKPRQQQNLEQRNSLVDRIARLRELISHAPEVGAQIEANEAEKVSLQRNMDEMQSKLDAARLGERLEEGDAAQQIEVIEEPEVAKAASGPRRLHLAAAVCAAAAMAAAAGIYAGHLFDRTVRGTFDLSHALAGETLVVIPHWKPKRRIAKAFRNSAFTNPSPIAGG
ncbi:hypothetical protein [Neorhizobium galegae]|uniref:GumC family protein n=1 Tax=Neorhizobium galegae TaxID=399 RepID=UPI000621FFA5|nr:hypothetical protein [Neorhizobium galegae]CDZ30671.1 Polysaccharide chain length determinant protein, PEP-CTERM locus subfamily [Neorhizobium galegae bv. officinalis]KAA9388580.1 hypothetical protein F4V88_20030 [Neorhizobium galegae]KAB1114026.1 hypothetical protein F4V89_10310 [Neorhizobium galegae]MCM2500970.1 hypothetical protein [Neorhizobium galegae]MCQ1771028.1 hypothetical protein [Neorhizobium galegae]